jgi:uncharacterized protein (DUF983 family)
MPLERWQPDRSSELRSRPPTTLVTAIGRGVIGRCPVCGKGKIFKGFLKVVPCCEVCAAPLGLARADDAPPYFTILLVGHIVIPLLLLTERSTDHLSLWILSAIFVPLTVGLAVALLRPIKGGTVGLMLNLNMLKSDASAI